MSGVQEYIVEDNGVYELLRPQTHDGVLYTHGQVLSRTAEDHENAWRTVYLFPSADTSAPAQAKMLVSDYTIGDFLKVPEYREEDDPTTYAGALKMFALIGHEHRKELARRVCRTCGCTEADCSQCIAKTGQPCSWVERDLCSACA